MPRIRMRSGYGDGWPLTDGKHVEPRRICRIHEPIALREISKPSAPVRIGQDSYTDLYDADQEQ